MSEFFDMSGYGAFIWSAYAIAAIVMVGLVVLTLRNLRANEAKLSVLEEQKQRRDRGLEDGPSAEVAS
jgi:heme exporter protein D